ncbi:uncharacterized protein LOC118756674 [Rhagoletis pomonella]|uniref:uncharacterized protein LOC118756674 n=1 Tax=Rhagoletis pomonella TaxID=28610 RepID=UPI0017823F82|nr:uncharacterized protein LOC118756674 [Rhagoletis pomonella]
MLGTGESKTVINNLTDVREALTECKVQWSNTEEYREELTSSSDEETDRSNGHKENVNNSFKYIQRAVFTLFWITLYVIAIQLQFGIVYIMLSALFGIYYNTRTAPKKLNEISAYSVFNKNCESIDGTLTAEQFEREIRFGASSVR